MKNVLREKILDRNYIELIDIIEISERNRDIVKKFVEGATYSAIAQEYNISPGRVRSIVFNYYRYCYNYHK